MIDLSSQMFSNRPELMATPLEVVLQFFKEKTFVVSWFDWITDARLDGWKDRTIRVKIISAINEIYGPIYCKKFEETLDECMRLHPMNIDEYKLKRDSQQL